MSYILHEKVEGFVSGLLVIQPAYSEKQFEKLIKPARRRKSSPTRSSCLMRKVLVCVIVIGRVNG
jgi:hypothetical protein